MQFDFVARGGTFFTCYVLAVYWDHFCSATCFEIYRGVASWNYFATHRAAGYRNWVVEALEVSYQMGGGSTASCRRRQVWAVVSSRQMVAKI